MNYSHKNKCIIILLSLACILLPNILFAALKSVHLKVPQEIAPAKCVKILKVTNEFLIAYFLSKDNVSYFVKFSMKGPSSKPLLKKYPFEIKRVYVQPVLIHENGKGCFFFRDQKSRFKVHFDKGFNMTYKCCDLILKTGCITKMTPCSLLNIDLKKKKLHVTIPKAETPICVKSFIKKINCKEVSTKSSFDGKTVLLEPFGASDKHFWIKRENSEPQIIEVSSKKAHELTEFHCNISILDVSKYGQKALYNFHPFLCEGSDVLFNIYLYSQGKFKKIKLPLKSCYSSIWIPKPKTISELESNFYKSFTITDSTETLSPYIFATNNSDEDYPDYEIYKFNYKEELFEKICDLPQYMHMKIVGESTIFIEPDYLGKNYLIAKNLFYSFSEKKWIDANSDLENVLLKNNCTNLLQVMRDPQFPALVFVNSEKNNITDLFIRFYQKPTSDTVENTNQIIFENPSDK